MADDDEPEADDDDEVERVDEVELNRVNNEGRLEDIVAAKDHTWWLGLKTICFLGGW